MSKVFISYARDGSFGEKLAAQTQPQLQSAGHAVFRDVTDLNPGDRWDTKLEFELETSDIVVLIVSEKVRTSEWVHNEISMAKEIGLPIIPVLSEKIRMPLWLRHLQILDFSESVEWEKLLSAVSTQCGGVAELAILPEQLKASIKARIPLKPKVPEQKALSQLQPAWAEDSGKDQYGHYADLKIKQVTQRFRFIEAGTFWMGSPDSESERSDNEDLHQVTLSEPFWLADTACTQALWQTVMGSNSSEFDYDPNNPVEWVSWEDSQQFIEKVSTQLKGVTPLLPTEAQWEYACRAGTDSPFSLGDNITPEQVNYNGNHPYIGGKQGQFREQTAPAKSLPANPWGLHEMHGNVWEWCQDGFQENLGAGASINPFIRTGAERVLRGGSWFDKGGGCRSASRFSHKPDFCIFDTGFRLALVS